MKRCPNCNVEVEPGFEICWNCNYDFFENKIVEYTEPLEKRELKCLRCATKMKFSGNYKFHEGFNTGLLGNLFEVFVNRESFDLYHCTQCGKIEFFIPQDEH